MIGLVFDIDDTLYDLQWPFKKACEEEFPGEALPFDGLFTAMRKHSDEVFEQSVSGEISMEDMYSYRIQKAFEDYSLSVSREEALDLQRAYASYQQKICLTNEMRELLQRLKDAGISLGIVSNGPSGHQWDKVRTLGLPAYMEKEKIIISGDAGCAKPGEEIFRAAEKAMGMDKSGLWFIGDTFRNDIEGAKNAGWHAIWYNHRDLAQPDGAASPDFIVKSEQEMIDLLLRLTGLA